MARWWSNSAADAQAGLVPALLAAVLLAGCGGDSPGESTSADGRRPVDALPTPAGTPGGSVTGMPAAAPPREQEPSVAELPPPAEPAAVADVPPPADPNAIPVDPVTGLAAGATPPAPPAPAASTAPHDVGGAADVVREYTAALAAGSFAAAQQLWSTTPNDARVLQLARGAAFAVDVLPPLRPADPAAAAGVVGVPVRVRGTGEDGSGHSLSVVYTVRRGADGQWRISAASLREATP